MVFQCNRTEEHEEAYHVLEELMNVHKKLLEGKTNSVAFGRSHYYLGVTCLEASKITLAMETLNSGLEILQNVFSSQEGTAEDAKTTKRQDSFFSEIIGGEETMVNVDLAALTAALGYGKLLTGEMDSAKGKLLYLEHSF